METNTCQHCSNYAYTSILTKDMKLMWLCVDHYKYFSQLELT